MPEYTDELPWSMWPWRCCKARLRAGQDAFFGRCELKPHGDDVEHALERGMIIVRWQDGAIRYDMPHYRT